VRITETRTFTLRGEALVGQEACVA